MGRCLHCIPSNANRTSSTTGPRLSKVHPSVACSKKAVTKDFTVQWNCWEPNCWAPISASASAIALSMREFTASTSFHWELSANRLPSSLFQIFFCLLSSTLSASLFLSTFAFSAPFIFWTLFSKPIFWRSSDQSTSNSSDSDLSFAILLCRPFYCHLVL